MRVDLLIPGLPAKADHFLFGICSLLLLRDGKRTILFDTGPFRVRPTLIAALAAHGLTPEQIDTVFVSHLHWDHIENIDLFRHAEILVPRLEFEYAAAIRPTDWGTPPYAREMLQGMRIELLDDREQEIFPGVRTLLLPGHSVGLQGLVVQAEQGALVLASDALWSARDAVRGHPDVAFFDPAKGQQSLDRALRAGAVYYPGHDRPFTLQDGRVNYLAQYTYQLRFSFQPDGRDIRTMISTEDRPQMISKAGASDHVA
ncbi:N-acyl homoserine lactonase family protein [Bradyrhizobium canariense]|uniref:Glyoxylase, beta-lactamase superfamily II n=1 Tax=Bradyrhizobium canariense TaxID=255045 RepID=A0A1H1NI57_9BRAD|nr:N-acyl homoserine lactonase family protein [Bradyrhizobium canariense]SDR98632.1 Glyoxylase, beta-lactamase superfamily II [Bradyrhizobium canariense]